MARLIKAISQWFYNRKHPMLYLACSMTGRDQIELIKEAKYITALFEKAGFRVFHPVLEEGLKHTHAKLTASSDTLPPKWKLDKWAIRHSIALIDTSADFKSEGREHEVGLMRYSYWRPVVRISPKHATGFFSIASLEDDVIVGTPEEAVAAVVSLYGTWTKRFIWRIKLYKRCLGRAVLEQLRGFVL